MVMENRDTGFTSSQLGELGLETIVLWPPGARCLKVITVSIAAVLPNCGTKAASVKGTGKASVRCLTGVEEGELFSCAC